MYTHFSFEASENSVRFSFLPDLGFVFPRHIRGSLENCSFRQIGFKISFSFTKNDLSTNFLLTEREEGKS